MDIDQSVDVVIPVYRPGKELEKLLYWLDKQTVSVRNVFIMHTREEEKLSLSASFRFHPPEAGSDFQSDIHSPGLHPESYRR